MLLHVWGARARAHMQLFRHFFSFRGCGVLCRKRARTCARAAFLALCSAFSLHRFSDEIARARVRTRGFLGTSSSFLVYCSEHWLRRNRARACAHAGFLAPRLVYCLHLGCSGPLLGSLGLFWASSEPLLGSLGPLLGSPGFFWAPPGLSWASPSLRQNGLGKPRLAQIGPGAPDWPRLASKTV